jgi:hypothetical protein
MFRLNFLRERSSKLFNFPKQWKSGLHYFTLIYCSLIQYVTNSTKQNPSWGYNHLVIEKFVTCYGSLKLIHYCVHNSQLNSVHSFTPYFFMAVMMMMMVIMMMISFHADILSGFFRLRFLNFVLYKILMAAVCASCPAHLDFTNLGVHECYNFTYLSLLVTSS